MYMLRPACMRRVSSELTHALSGLHAPYEPPTCVRKNLRSTDCDHLLNVLGRLPSSLTLAVNCKAALAKACTSVVAALFAPLSVHGHSYHHCHDHLCQNYCGQCIRNKYVVAARSHSYVSSNAGQIRCCIFCQTCSRHRDHASYHAARQPIVPP